jgi:pimeloyl-ACP methyl ester carboxylesterase
MTNITHAYAEVNGVRLHYAEAGAGDLVILLHGFPEFWYTWRPQLAALASEHHVVAPDMRGYNLSAKPPNVSDYRIETVARDVVGLIDHFGVAQASIVAHDWGAGVAWSVAQQFPERVSKLAVLQVPPAAAWRDNITLKQLFRSWYMMFFQLPGIPEWLISRKNFALLEKMFRETVVRKNTFSDADIEAYKEALRQPGALTAAFNYYRANVRRLIAHSSSHAAQVDGLTDPGEVQAQRDGRIRVSTLFIFGEQDFAIVPATARKVERYINAPYCELRIPDSGHWVQNEAPEEVNAALVEFLRA